VTPRKWDGRPQRRCDRAPYRERNRVERLVNTLEQLEFLRAPSLSMGIYALASGTEDSSGEEVHPTEDEVYCVLGGPAGQPALAGSGCVIPL
jgi:hypothetical protein